MGWFGLRGQASTLSRPLSTELSIALFVRSEAFRLATSVGSVSLACKERLSNTALNDRISFMCMNAFLLGVGMGEK